MIHFRSVLQVERVCKRNAAMDALAALREALAQQPIAEGGGGLTQLLEHFIERAQAAHERALVRARAEEPALFEGRSTYLQ